LKIIVFSKDRPMQLDLFLKSFGKNCKDSRIADLSVLYQTSNEDFEEGYRQVAIENSQHSYIKESNFYQNTLNLIENHEQIIFATDDTIWISEFNLVEPSKILAKDNDMIGFSFRLGTNIQYCYSLNQPQSIPNFETVKKNIIRFCWTSGNLDFAYPLEISSSLFSLKNIKKCLNGKTFSNPNNLEDALASSLRLFLEKPFLGCYEQSVAFGNPLNDVAKHGNRFSQKEKFSSEEMLTKYQNGFRVNLDILDGFVPVAPHQEFELY